MKTLKVGIESYEEMKARTLAIAKGSYKPSSNEPQIWFSSAESFAKVLSDKNRKLLELIAETNPNSISELVTKTGRAKSNLSRTLKTMENYGLVILKKLSEGRIAPRVVYKNITLTLQLS